MTKDQVMFYLHRARKRIPDKPDYVAMANAGLDYSARRAIDKDHEDAKKEGEALDIVIGMIGELDPGVFLPR